MAEPNEDRPLLDLTSEFIAACAGNQTLSASDLPPLIAGVFTALQTAGEPAGSDKPPGGPEGGKHHDASRPVQRAAR